MAYGVVSTGFARKSLGDILAEVEAANRTTFGVDVVQSPVSPLGQLNGLFSDILTDLWEIAEDVYQSYDPDQSEGMRLDALAKIRLLTRAQGELDPDFRLAITNAGRARVDIQDLHRAVRGLTGVTYTHVVINDTDTVDIHGISSHSVAVAVMGGSDSEIAAVIREYVVPGVGTFGAWHTSIIDGYCRTLGFTRPVPTPISLTYEVRTRNDRFGCPPPAATSMSVAVAEWLSLEENRPLNGQDITEHLARAAISSQFDNVEVLSVGPLPVSIPWTQIATFSAEDIVVQVANQASN